MMISIIPRNIFVGGNVTFKKNQIISTLTTNLNVVPSLNPTLYMYTCNSLDNKGSCWIFMNFYFSVTMLNVRELGLKWSSRL